MKIPTFEEFVAEGLWNKGLNRNKSNEKRKEDLTSLDNICKFAGEFIAKKLKIEYKPELCVYYEDEDYNESHEDTKQYNVYMDFSELGDEYNELIFSVTIFEMDGGIDNEEEVIHKFAENLDEFQDQMEYEDYKDEYSPSKKEFNKIKRILSQLVSEIYKKF